MKVQTVYNEQIGEYFLRQLLFGFIPWRYYNIDDLINNKDTDTYYHNGKDGYVERWCGVRSQERVIDAILVLKDIKQYNNRPKAKVIATEKI